MDRTCSCCGEERPAAQVAALQCHADIQVCRGCISWLRHRAGMVESTPTLPVLDMTSTISFYETAGFSVRAYDSGFAFVQFDSTSAFDLAHHADLSIAHNRAGCYLVVPDADTWHRRLSAAHLAVTSLDTMPWGMREFTLTDPNNNRIRIGTGA